VARGRAALPAMLPLGSGMGQKSVGGRKSDRIQDDNEVCCDRCHIYARMQDFLTERAMNGVVKVLRCRLRWRRNSCDVTVGWKRRAVNVGLDSKALDRENHQHEQQRKPR
jgi:hypothetical protein